MTTDDRPQLTLSQPPGQLSKKLGAVPRAWFFLFLLIQVAVLALSLALWFGARSTGGEAAVLAAEDLQSAALALEERGLEAAAAEAWEARAAEAAADEKGPFYYRAGKLRMQAQQYEAAAAALVRAELACDEKDPLREDIGRRMIECLRKLGRYGEVDRELSRQVDAVSDDPGRGKVLARLSGDELTEADLDRMIEAEVDRMLASRGTDPAARQALLKQINTPQTRQQILQQMLQSELFARRARELKMDRDADFTAERDRTIEILLAGRFLAAELEKIRPTRVDLESYYQAHADLYTEPERREVTVLVLGEDEDAGELLDKIDSPEAFRKLADERSEQSTARTLERGKTDAVLGDPEAFFAMEKDTWTEEPVTHDGAALLVLAGETTPPRTAPLDEVIDRVRSDYVQEKQQELGQALMQDLMQRYDVELVAPEAGESSP